MGDCRLDEAVYGIVAYREKERKKEMVIDFALCEKRQYRPAGNLLQSMSKLVEAEEISGQAVVLISIWLALLSVCLRFSAHDPRKR